MSCEDYELLLMERHVDGKGLPRGADDHLAAHLATCAPCRDFAQALTGPLAPQSLRAELRASDPGDAFFVRARNGVWDILQEEKRAAVRAEPRASEGAGFFARVYEAIFVQRRGLATAGLATAAIAVITIALWPKAMEPPAFVHPGIAGVALPSGGEQPFEGEGVLAEVGSLSRTEMASLAGKLVIETFGEVRGGELDEEPDAVESQIESLSDEELSALDAKIAQATKEAKGA